MRAIRVLAVVLAAAGAVASVSLGQSPRKHGVDEGPRIGARKPALIKGPRISARTRAAREAGRLPAPVTIAAGRMLGTVIYRLATNLSIHRLSVAARPFPPGAIWSPGSDAWFKLQRGHLVVGRGRTTVWRSHGVFAQPHRNSAKTVGAVTVGPHALAFTYDDTLYLAPLGGAERAVTRGEFPLGWTSGGLYTAQSLGREMFLRAYDGRLLDVIERRTFDSAYAPATGELYFTAHRTLMVAHGTHVRRVASLARLGLRAWPPPELQPAGRLLELQGSDRLVVLRADGSLFASSPVPRIRGPAGGIDSSLAVAPRASAVAFSAASGRLRGSAAVGAETIYVLRAGAHAAVPLHREPVKFNPCAHFASLQWRGSWLLYGNSEGTLAAIDVTDARRTIEMPGVVKRLPDTRWGYSTYWSGQPRWTYL